MANEKRLIDANELEEKFRVTKIIEVFPEWENLSFQTKHKLVQYGKTIKMFVQNASSVEAVEVVHGRWITESGDFHSSGYPIWCSECNKLHFVHYRFTLGSLCACKELFEKPKFCPSCGAVMEIEE